jgi:hypothetical protein
VALFALEQLEVAGGALEGREAPRTPAPALRASSAIERSHGSGRPDQPAQQE